MFEKCRDRSAPRVVDHTVVCVRQVSCEPQPLAMAGDDGLFGMRQIRLTASQTQIGAITLQQAAKLLDWVQQPCNTPLSRMALSAVRAPGRISVFVIKDFCCIASTQVHEDWIVSSMHVDPAAHQCFLLQCMQALQGLLPASKAIE